MLTILGVRRAKQHVQDIFLEAELIIDQPSGTNTKGGTSNDGNQARRFFSQKLAAIVVRKIHTNLSVILRTISSTGQIHYEKLDKLNKETSLIYINNGWSIGTLSEEPLESFCSSSQGPHHQSCS